MEHGSDPPNDTDDSGSDWSAPSDASGMFDSFDPGDNDITGTGHGVRVDAMMWQPLAGPDDIRVIVFEPTLDLDSPVRFKFEVTSLSKPRKYHALSYAWGPIHSDGSHLTEYVFIDDLGHRVTKHLNQGLKRIREHWRGSNKDSTNPRQALWCDALSIDQRNLVERSHQVALMGRIYASAQSSLVWLGESHRLYGLLSRNKTERRPTARESSIDMRRSGEQQWRASRDDLSLREIGQAHTYFHRRWVVQELLLQDNREVFAGRNVLALQTKEGPDDSALLPSPDAGAHETSSGTRYTLSLLKRIIDDELKHKPSLLQNLIHHYLADCSDPRDRIYALLAVSYDDHGVRPDYRKSVEQVYTELAAHYACSGWVTTVLGCASSCRPTDLPTTSRNVPSWVPDWRYFDGSRRSTPLMQGGNATVTDGNTLEVEVWVTLCEHEQGASDGCAVCTIFEVPVALGAVVERKSTLCECYVADSFVRLTLWAIGMDGEHHVPPTVGIDVSDYSAAPLRLIPTNSSGETYQDAELVSWAAPGVEYERFTRRVQLKRRTIRFV
ncbi:hypothetical protein LTR17_021678 [Elasticomyces elasticus]|nr:hypothetical protein LTR17_021678 [Elasticomyces elasticus]